MYRQISFVILILFSFIMVMALTVNADQSVEGEKKQDVIKKIESYVKNDTSLKNGFLINNPETGKTLNLNYDYVHDSVKKTDDGRYFACVDFKDQVGNIYDLDFYLDEKGERLSVDQIVLHKKNGKSIN